MGIFYEGYFIVGVGVRNLVDIVYFFWFDYYLMFFNGVVLLNDFVFEELVWEWVNEVKDMWNVG